MKVRARRRSGATRRLFGLLLVLAVSVEMMGAGDERSAAHAADRPATAPATTPTTRSSGANPYLALLLMKLYADAPAIRYQFDLYRDALKNWKELPLAVRGKALTAVDQWEAGLSEVAKLQDAGNLDAMTPERIAAYGIDLPLGMQVAKCLGPEFYRELPRRVGLAGSYELALIIDPVHPAEKFREQFKKLTVSEELRRSIDEKANRYVAEAEVIVRELNDPKLSRLEATRKVAPVIVKGVALWKELRPMLSEEQWKAMTEEIRKSAQ